MGDREMRCSLQALQFLHLFCLIYGGHQGQSSVVYRTARSPTGVGDS